MTQLKTSRGLIKFILLTFITCSIYPFFFIHSLAKDLNLVCQEDGRKTAGLIKLFLLSFITCGIYGIIWWYSSANRIADYGKRHSVNVKTSGMSWLLWNILGSLLCGLGPLIAMHNYLHSMNDICKHAIAREQAEKLAAEQAAAAAAAAQVAAAEAAAKAEAEAAAAAEAAAQEAPAAEAPAAE